jgi:putative MATE family efflux protein
LVNSQSISKSKQELFETTPVLRAVLALEAPTILSQLITVAYNMADTFFIGRAGDPRQVAAVSVCLPTYMLLTGMANLLGIGAASLISRSMGSGELERAGKASAFSVWTAGVVALLYGVLCGLFGGRFYAVAGADAEVLGFCRQYAFWVLTLGAVPTVLSGVFAHLVRSQGYAREASIGVAAGGLLNIVLDPVFITRFGLQIRGAAITTLLSNLASMAYFLWLMNRKRADMVLSLSPRKVTLGEGIPSEILLVGLPSAIMNLCAVLSNIVMNRLMGSYGSEAVAAMGIAKKVDMINFAVAVGMSQGVIPMVGYNYSSGNHRRMMAAIRTTFILSIAVGIVSTVFLLTGAGTIVRAFIDDARTVELGSRFQRIVCLTGAFIPISMIIITIFQATGAKGIPLLLSVLRRGGVDIPAMLILNRLMGIDGVVWATPVSDTVAMLVSVSLFLPFWKRLKTSLGNPENGAAGEAPGGESRVK